jgi:hypothetical protein
MPVRSHCAELFAYSISSTHDLENRREEITTQQRITLIYFNFDLGNDPA